MASPVPARDTARVWLLGIVAATWTMWCLVAVAPAASIVLLFAEISGRPALRTNVPFGLAVELVVVGLSAWLAFQLARRLDPPKRYWLVGPVGYLLSYVLWAGIVWLAGDTIAGLDAGSLLRLVGSMGVAAAGAYLGLAPGGVARVPRPMDAEPGDERGAGD